METQIDENKIVIETLERLRRNSDYQYLCSHLTNIKSSLDKMVFNEDIPHEKKLAYIIRSNSIKIFIELTDDLIEQFTPVEN